MRVGDDPFDQPAVSEVQHHLFDLPRFDGGYRPGLQSDRGRFRTFPSELVYAARWLV